MRYQDWDVLLFPAALISPASPHSTADGGSSNDIAPNSTTDPRIPVKEFRTTCHAEITANSPQAVPLLTCFVPSLPKGVPFQISVHSWVKTGPKLGFASAAENPQRVEEVWQVKVVVDGVLMGLESWGVEGGWPRVISMMNFPTTGAQGGQLRFPSFHQEIVMQSGWCAADRTGRIRVEIAAGYVFAETGHFVKMADVVTFAFQHAPLETLEQCGVAWPNNHMYAAPAMQGGYLGGQSGAVNTKTPTKRKKAASTSNIGTAAPSYQRVQVAAPCPLRSNMIISSGNYDLNSSRSTSAYSTVPDMAAPLIAKGMYHTDPGYADAYRGTAQQSGSQKQQPQLSFRLPSDQLNKIIDALGKKPQDGATYKQTAAVSTSSPSTTMPPPPVPQRALPSNEAAGQNTASTPSQVHLQASPVLSPANNRREESRLSDVSMHNNCTGFPACTTEDANGKVVHAQADCPSPVVKGKKEGSSTAPKRKLSDPAEKTDKAEKKRPRRSSRLLQHDSGYAGGPSDNDDDRDGGAGNA